MNYKKSLIETIPISLIIAFFAAMLLDGGLLSGPLILSNIIWVIFLSTKLMTAKDKKISQKERYVIILSPIYLSLLGVVVSTIARILR